MQHTYRQIFMSCAKQRLVRNVPQNRYFFPCTQWLHVYCSAAVNSRSDIRSIASSYFLHCSDDDEELSTDGGSRLMSYMMRLFIDELMLIIQSSFEDVKCFLVIGEDRDDVQVLRQTSMTLETGECCPCSSILSDLVLFLLSGFIPSSSIWAWERFSWRDCKALLLVVLDGSFKNLLH